MATAEAPAREEVEEKVAADDGSKHQGGSSSQPKQPEVVVVDAGDEPITMPSLCMNCYDNVR